MENKMEVKIKAVMSVPRLGFNDHFGSMQETLGKFGIPIAWYTGAYWEKCIESALEDCINPPDPLTGIRKPSDVDWILTLDYDTLATPQHFHRMIETFARHPEMDALAANQPRRGTGMPLWTVRGVEGEFVSQNEGTWVQAQTAHFGFTLIRASSLRSVPKPWFISLPSHDCRETTWRGEGHVDADINFWKTWEAAGKTLFIEQSVCIGHIEAMVSLFEQRERPDGALELVQTYISCPEWRKRYSGSGGMASLGEKETLNR